MSPAFWIWSHLAFVLLVASLMSPLLKRRGGLQSGLLCVLVPIGLGLVPVRQTDLSGLTLAHTGTFSVPTLFLLLYQLLTDWRLVPPVRMQEQRNMNLFWLAIGILLYPSALGLFESDIYAFGYHNAFSWCVLTVSGIAVLCKQRIPGLCLASAVLAHLLKLHESPNVWDYLVDPWLCLAATLGLCAAVWRHLLCGERKGVRPPRLPMHTPESSEIPGARAMTRSDPGNP